MTRAQLLLNEWLKIAVVFGSKFGASLVIFIAFWIASALAKRLILQLSRVTDAGQQDVVELLAGIAKVSILTFGAVTALGTVGVNVSALVAGLGLTGFALGFAFRDALSNLLAGVMILMYHPFRRGDRIAVAGSEGTVVGIDLRYTTLQGDDRMYLIPNSNLFTNTITVLAQRTPPPAS